MLIILDSTHQSLGLFDVFMSEKKLAVQIAEIDGVKVDNVDFPEARQGKILQQLAPNAPGAYQQNA